tara:strand:+ start:943 stop:2004 length:1062 start_codon:yes stop_codon:yes gene_type:complete
MKKIVLITGSSGLVGSEASLFFLSKGYRVLGIDNNERKNLFGTIADTNWKKKELLRFSNFNHYNINICNKVKLNEIFKKFKNKIVLIIHCAAQPSHDWAYKEPIKDFNINALGTLNILEAFKKYCPRSKFIHMSTNKVYGDNPNKIEFIEKKSRWELSKKNIYYDGFKENFNIDNCVHSLFGVSKLYSDIIVQEYGKNFNLDTVVFRAGCITGPNHSGAKLHGFLSFLVKSCITKKKYEIIGYKGKQVRDNIHSIDLVNCFWQFFLNSKKKGEVYNIGGGRFSNCSVIEALNYVEKKLNIKVKKKIISKPRVGDHMWYITNNEKFSKDFPNWKQQYNTKRILDEIILSIKIKF